MSVAGTIEIVAALIRDDAGRVLLVRKRGTTAFMQPGGKRDFASAADADAIDRGIADHALSALEVDSAGLDAMDRRYLSTIAMNYGGGPVGVETMAAALSEPRDAIEDIIEPFLIQCGYLQRTPRGRLLTSHAFRHLGLTEPARDPAQFGLFGASEDE